VDTLTSVSQDTTSKSSTSSYGRITETKNVKRAVPVTVGAGTSAQKGGSSSVVNRRQSLVSNQDVDSNVRTGSETDLVGYDFSDDFDLYFVEPQQLLTIFTELEEQNLSLIQNSQDHEEQLEEITRELQATMKKKNSETESLQRQVNSLEQAILIEEQKEKELMAKVGYEQTTDTLFCSIYHRSCSCLELIHWSMKMVNKMNILYNYRLLLPMHTRRFSMKILLQAIH
jgi:hypothetical protein